MPTSARAWEMRETESSEPSDPSAINDLTITRRSIGIHPMLLLFYAYHNFNLMFPVISAFLEKYGRIVTVTAVRQQSHDYFALVFRALRQLYGSV